MKWFWLIGIALSPFVLAWLAAEVTRFARRDRSRRAKARRPVYVGKRSRRDIW